MSENNDFKLGEIVYDKLLMRNDKIVKMIEEHELGKGSIKYYKLELHTNYVQGNEIEKIKPKKKITLYRYTVKTTKGYIYQSLWCTNDVGDYVVLKDERLLETETKTVEVENG